MICKKCLQDKAEDQFYKSNRTRCKECVKASANQYRQENLERVRAYDQMRASMPHRVTARQEYQKTQQFAQSHSAAAKRWAAKHPKRREANVIVGHALRDGKLQKVPCHVCGCENVEAHHPDYDRPLDVVWLCSSHHKEAHAIAKELEVA